MIDFFFTPFRFEFMQSALLMGLAVALVCSVLSCFVILKGWSLMGDAISHAVLPGVVFSYVVGIPLIIGAFISGIACTFTVGYLKNNSRLKEDTLMGIVFTTFFAVGLVWFSEISANQHLLHILFGNLLGIPHNEFVQTLWIALVCFLLLLIKIKDFQLYCFDPSHARIAGLNTVFLHYALLFILGLTIVSAMQVVGIVLVIALLIAPGITAYQLTQRFTTMVILAVLVSLLSTFVGIVLSFHLDLATGPLIVVVQAVFFFLSLLVKHFLVTKQNKLIKVSII